MPTTENLTGGQGKAKIPSEKEFLKRLLGQLQAADRIAQNRGGTIPQLATAVRMSVCRLKDLEEK